MTMPLLVAMQWLGVDATGQRNARQKKTPAIDTTSSAEDQP
jgi:putative spermidine/putrescine transport system permease protein